MLFVFVSKLKQFNLVCLGIYRNHCVSLPHQMNDSITQFTWSSAQSSRKDPLREGCHHLSRVELVLASAGRDTAT